MKGFLFSVCAVASILELTLPAQIAPPRLELVPQPYPWLMLTWSNYPTPVTLESRDSLRGPPAWQTTTQTPELYEDQYFLALDKAGTSRFFRLRSDGTPATPLRLEIGQFSYTLSWPGDDPNYVLESTDTLGGSNSWRLFPYPPQAQDGRLCVGVNLNSRMLFYRLRALPRDPAQLAPALSPQVITTIEESTAFLYSGANPMQTGVAKGTIAAQRAAVLRGQVKRADGSALPGATVSIQNHPELGQTSSRADGRFDLAVNGGDTLQVHYHANGFLDAHQPIFVPCQDYLTIPAIALLTSELSGSAVNLAANPGVLVASGRTVTDESGTRRPLLMIPAGTTAAIITAAGVTQAVSTLTPRFVEYTVGTNGPQAMPAPLPPTVGYTYCIELGTAEAQAKVAGQDLLFNQPVYFYLENFLGFPAGIQVPAAYFDPERGLWIPSPDGRVIRLIGISTSGLAEVDATGSGSANSAQELAAFGFTDEERRKLADTYGVSQTLWRVPLTHLSTYDCNYGVVPGEDATAPNPASSFSDKKIDQNDANQQPGYGSLELQNQVFRESLQVVGTPFSLHYSSDRVPGYRLASVTEIVLSEASIPASLKRIELEVHIAGQSFKQTFPAQRNLRYTFEWDGRDGYGRAVTGTQPARIRMGYVYDGYYSLPPAVARSFGLPSGTRIPGNIPARQEVILWSEQTTRLGHFSRQESDCGGWNLTPHHRYDPVGRILYYGDGRQRTTQKFKSNFSIHTIAGTGGSSTNIGDGGWAADAIIRNPHAMIQAPNGSLFVAEEHTCRVRRIDADGTIRTVAGRTDSDLEHLGYNPGYSGDGGPATEAELNTPRGLALAADGSLYISDSENNCIRRVDPNGIITTVAGLGGTQQGYAGDGGPATAARLSRPYGIVVGLDGSLIFSDSGSYRIRRVGPDGTIETLAGNGSFTGSGDGGPARKAGIYSPRPLTQGPDGSLYFTDAYGNQVRRIGPDGIIRRFAGTGGSGYSGDGGPALQAKVAITGGLLMTRGENLYFVTDNGRIRVVDPRGNIDSVAGTGTIGFSGDGGPALQAAFSFAYGITTLAEEPIYVSDGNNGRIRALTLAMPGLTIGELYIPSEDGAELYQFRYDGRHLRTLNALTGAVRFEFGYDDGGWLVQIQDGDGKVVRIERDGLQTPTAIVSAFGQRTTLSVDADGFLASITNPARETTRLAHAAGGLLTSITSPAGATYTAAYTALGQVVRANDPAGGFSELSRQTATNGFTVIQTTATGRTNQYRVADLSPSRQRQTDVWATGATDERITSASATQTNRWASGVTESLAFGGDPRYGMVVPLTTLRMVATPAGLVSTNRFTRTTNSIQGQMIMTNRYDSNGRVSTTVFVASNLTLLTRSAEGRQTESQLDTQGRVLVTQVPGLETISYQYQTNGLLGSVTQGAGQTARSTRFAYDTNGLLASATDPLNQVEFYRYDAAGRLIEKTLRDGRLIGFGYDGHGNLTTVTPPGGSAYTFGYTPVDLSSQARLPLVEGTAARFDYAYNADRQITNTVKADGQVITFAYDQGGRLATLTLPDHQKTYTYYPSTGTLRSLNRTTGANLAYEYDGEWLVHETWSGIVTGRVSRTYDHNFQFASHRVNGQAVAAYGYDADELPTHAGALVMVRDPQNGRLVSATLSNTVDQWEYNGFGETAHYRASVSGVSVLDLSYSRDKLGRLTQQVEVVADVTTTIAYSYDRQGRLLQVLRNGTVAADYVYDAHGNRSSRTTPAVAVNGVYDARDRLLSYGTAQYAHDANGALTNRISTAGATRYRYDGQDSLVEVNLPDGTRIEYVLDGVQRRVARKLNGVVTHGFLYLDHLRPIVELDATGQVRTLFIYGRAAAVPDYLVKNGVTYRVFTDSVGSPRLVVNAQTGEIAQRLDYDEFGQVLVDTQPGFQPFGYAGGLYDPATGLVHFGLRDYDPEIGRWTTPDPLRFASGSMNWYEYAGSQPVNRVDPLGLFYFATGPNGGGGYAAVAGVSGSVEGGYVIGTSQNGGWKQAGYTSEAMTLNLGIGAGLGRGWSFTLSPFGNVEDYKGDSWTWSISGSLLVKADITISMPVDVTKPSSWSGFWKGAITVSPGVEAGTHGWVSTGMSTTQLYPIPIPSEPAVYQPPAPALSPNSNFCVP